MPDYSKGKIYKITNTVNDKVYIGSTVSRLCDRMARHRHTGRHACEESPLYREMYAIGADKFKIILVRTSPSNNRDELVAIEYAIMQEFRDSGICLLNAVIHGIVPEDSRKRMGAANTGSLNYGFQRGCIYYSLRSDTWIFQWNVNTKHVVKSFGCRAWGGSWSARKMCIAWQDYIYPPK
jgi:hypothetical protein